jgi:hypothetical protein
VVDVLKFVYKDRFDAAMTVEAFTKMDNAKTVKVDYQKAYQFIETVISLVVLRRVIK